MDLPNIDIKRVKRKLTQEEKERKRRRKERKKLKKLRQKDQEVKELETLEKVKSAEKFTTPKYESREKSLESIELVKRLKEGLRDIPKEFQMSDFKHVSVVARAISGDPNQQLSNLNEYIEKLNECVEKTVDVNYRGFNTSIRNFSTILNHIEVSQKNVEELDSNMKRCEELLVSRSGDLAQLYATYVQNSESLRILEMVEEVKGVIPLLEQALNTKHYLYSVNILLKNQKLLARPELINIKGLCDIRSDLNCQEKELPAILVNEITKYCYKGVEAPSADSPEEPLHLGENKGSERELLMKMRKMSQMLDTTNSFDIKDDDLTLNPEENQEYFMSMIIEALDKLGKLSEAESELMKDLPKQIQNLISCHFKTFSHELKDNPEYWECTRIESKEKRLDVQGPFLKKMMRELFEKLLVVVKHFNFVLEKIKVKLKVNVNETNNDLTPLLDKKLDNELLLRINDKLRMEIDTYKDIEKTEAVILYISTLHSVVNNISLGESRFSQAKSICEMFWMLLKERKGTVTESKFVKFKQQFNNLVMSAIQTKEKLFSVNFVWKTIQREIRDFLGELLNIERFSEKSNHEKRGSKGIQFKFGIVEEAEKENSESQSLSVYRNSFELYLKSSYNMIYLCIPLKEFIEQVMKIRDDVDSTLIQHYIDDDIITYTLIPRIRNDFTKKLSTLLEEEEAFQPKITSYPVPLLTSSMKVEKWVNVLIRYARAISSHRSVFLSIIEVLLSKYIDRCKKELEKATIDTYAMECLINKERKIPELMKRDLKFPTALKSEVQFDSDDDENENVDQYSTLYSDRLFGVLDSPLSSRKSITRNMIIVKSTNVIILCNLYSTMEWFSNQLLNLRTVPILNQMNTPNQRTLKSKSIVLTKEETEKLLENLDTRLRSGAVIVNKNVQNSEVMETKNASRLQLAKHASLKYQSVVAEPSQQLLSLEKYANLCCDIAISSILSLKIDLRTRCHFYLRSIRLGNYFIDDPPGDPEHFITTFNQNLKDLADCFCGYLSPDIIAYIFSGVDELICRIFSDSLPKCVNWKFNQYGVDKMTRNIYAIQQNLANILHLNEESIQSESHYSFFAKVTDYYQMLLLPTMELFSHFTQQLDQALERKTLPKYSLDEYLALLQTETHLHHRNTKQVPIMRELYENMIKKLRNMDVENNESDIKRSDDLDDDLDDDALDDESIHD